MGATLTRSEMRVLAARVFGRSFDDFCVWVAETFEGQCPKLAAELRQMTVITNFGQAFAAIRRFRRVSSVCAALLDKARAENISTKDLDKWVDLPRAWNEDASPCQSLGDDDDGEDEDDDDDEKVAEEDRQWEDDSDLVYPGEEEIFANEG